MKSEGFMGKQRVHGFKSLKRDKKFLFRLTEDEHKTLHKKAIELHITKSELMRRIIMQYLG